MKLIDADAVIELFKPFKNALDDEKVKSAYIQTLTLIHNAPSIDIVRCKECRWGKPYSDKQLECDALGLGGLKFPDDFCSYGERKDQ